MSFGEAFDTQIKIVILCIVIGLNHISHGFGQTENETLILDESEAVEESNILEELEHLRENPLDMNKADYQDLQTIPFLNAMDIQKIIQERKRKGLFRSESDFHKRLGFDKDFWDKIKPYIFIQSAGIKKNSLFQMRLRTQRNYSPCKNKETGNYIGSLWKWVQRNYYSPQNGIEACVITEKDAGEKGWSDHMAGYFSIKPNGKMHMVFGNYTIEAGHGLVLWGPDGYSKSVDPALPVKSHARGIRGFRSTSESRYLTGAALSYCWDAFRIHGFISSRALDASINGNGTVSSLDVSGYHRTEDELSKKGTLNEFLYGIHFLWTHKRGNIGFSAWRNHYSRLWNPEDSVRHHFAFRDRENYVLGLSWDHTISPFYITGELAVSQSRGWAWTGNIILKRGIFDMIVSYRFFSPDFQNPYSFYFGENEPCNQQGFYLGVKGQMNNKLKFSLYYDLDRHPWRTYFIPVPTQGDDILFFLCYKVNSRLQFQCRATWRRKNELQDINNNPSSSSRLSARDQRNVRLDFTYKISRQLYLKGRCEYCEIMHGPPLVSIEQNSGFLYYQEIRLDVLKGLTINGRISVFDSDSYDSRLYAFENDLPGVMAIHPLYGKGMSWFVLAKWKWHSFLALGIKYRNTNYEYVSSSSSSNRPEVHRHDYLGIQTDLKF